LAQFNSIRFTSADAPPISPPCALAVFPAKTAVLPQQGCVLFQPDFGGAVIGTKPFHFPPESIRMIHLPTMGEFVENDVVAD
jgi:hypothetical protein